MKKLLSLLACAIIAITASADVKTVYVNPMQNDARVDNVVANRHFKKAMLGLTKAKTISVASGTQAIKPGSSEAGKYDYIMTLNISKATVDEAGTLGNLVGAVGGLLGSSSANKEPDWCGKLYTDVVIYDATTGGEVFKTTLEPYSVNKDKTVVLFNATNNFDYDMTDMTDDAFRVGGDVLDAYEVDKKNIVKKVRIGIGSKNGARKNQAYELYKVVGDKQELIGAAKCEQVLGPEESILSINGKKDADKAVSELIQNNDGSYTIQAWSRSRSGFLHNNFQGIDKMFTKDGRANYKDPFGRTTKPRVAFLGITINDNNFSNQKKNLENQVVKGMAEVSTINLAPTIYPSVEAARKDGIEGLIEITIDKVYNKTEKDKEGKTIYNTEILYTISGIDASNNNWIEMKSYNEHGSSKKGTAEANADALGLVDNNVQKFAEDVFPVAASIVNSEEVKKNSVKKVSIDTGTNMGIKKGMTFDIFEQRAEGGADSRFLLGEGKVEKDGLTATSAILKVKGKNNGDEKLFELLQNADETTKVVLISKANRNFLDKGLDFLNKTK